MRKILYCHIENLKFEGFSVSTKSLRVGKCSVNVEFLKFNFITMPNFNTLVAGVVCD